MLLTRILNHKTINAYRITSFEKTGMGNLFSPIIGKPVFVTSDSYTTNLMECWSLEHICIENQIKHSRKKFSFGNSSNTVISVKRELVNFSSAFVTLYKGNFDHFDKIL